MSQRHREHDREPRDASRFAPWPSRRKGAGVNLARRASPTDARVEKGSFGWNVVRASVAGSVGLRFMGVGDLIDHPFTFECIRVRTLLLLFAYVWFVTAVPGALGLTQEPGFFPRCTAPLLSCSHHATAQRGPPCTLRSAQSPLAPASALWSGIFGCRRPCARPRASGLHPTVHDVVRAMLRCIRSLPLYRSFDARVRARVLSEPQHGTPPLSPTSEASRTPTLIM